MPLEAEPGASNSPPFPPTAPVWHHGAVAIDMALWRCGLCRREACVSSVGPLDGPSPVATTSPEPVSPSRAWRVDVPLT